MILSIFSDIWDKLTEFSNECYSFIMEHFDNPIFWTVLVIILLIICYSAISNIANK